jgi:hypothetical protein
MPTFNTRARLCIGSPILTRYFCRLSEITSTSICNGEEVLVSVSNTLEAIVAKNLRKCCQAAQAAVLNSTSRIEMASTINDIREKLSLIVVDPGKIDALLYDIRHGRVTIFKNPDQDARVQDAADSRDLNGNARRARHTGEKIGSDSRIVVLKIPSTKLKSSHISAANDDRRLPAKSSRGRTTTELPRKAKHNSIVGSKPGPDHRSKALKATHHSASQDRVDSRTATSKSGKRKGEDGPFGEGNTPQAPMKRRMAMKEESFKGSQ